MTNQPETALSSSVPDTAVDVLRTSGLAALFTDGDPCHLTLMPGLGSLKLPLCAGE